MMMAARMIKVCDVIVINQREHRIHDRADGLVCAFVMRLGLNRLRELIHRWTDSQSKEGVGAQR